MLEFEFRINTGNVKTVYYCQPTYGDHEANIMTDYITQLENNNWIRDGTGPWCTLLLLAAKPHQDYCVHIDKFVWRLCVSYRRLNSVTRSFEFPILRYSNNIEDLGDLFGILFFISLDARSCYC